MNTERHAGRPDDPADWDEGERDALAGLERQIETMRLRHRGDPPPDVLYAARHDVLPGEWQTQVDTHLTGSRWSRTLVEGLAADADRMAEDEDRLDAVTEARLLARITREVRGVPSTSPRRWLHPVPLWIGAAVAATVLIVLFARPKPQPARPAPVMTGTDAAAQPAPPPLAEARPAPAFELPFDKPAVRLSANALVWRGPATDTPAKETYLADLKAGLDAYRASDYGRAEAALGAVRARYPGAVEAAFYQGASRLLAGDAAGALEPLADAARVNDPAFATETVLLLAAAEQRTGRADAARTRLRQACKAGGAQRDRACNALARLDAAVPAAPPSR